MANRTSITRRFDISPDEKERLTLLELLGRDPGTQDVGRAREEITRLTQGDDAKRNRLTRIAMEGDAYQKDAAHTELARMNNEADEAANLDIYNRTKEGLTGTIDRGGGDIRDTGATIEPQEQFLSRARGIDRKSRADQYSYHMGEVDRLTKLIDKLKSEQRADALLKDPRYEMGPDGKLKKREEKKRGLRYSEKNKIKSLQKRVDNAQDIVDAWDSGTKDKDKSVETDTGIITIEQRNAAERNINKWGREIGDMEALADEITSGGVATGRAPQATSGYVEFKDPVSGDTIRTDVSTGRRSTGRRELTGTPGTTPGTQGEAAGDFPMGRLLVDRKTSPEMKEKIDIGVRKAYEQKKLTDAQWKEWQDAVGQFEDNLRNVNRQSEIPATQEDVNELAVQQPGVVPQVTPEAVSDDIRFRPSGAGGGFARDPNELRQATIPEALGDIPGAVARAVRQVVDNVAKEGLGGKQQGVDRAEQIANAYSKEFSGQQIGLDLGFSEFVKALKSAGVFIADEVIMRAYEYLKTTKTPYLVD